jgi:hypothetical protein
VPTEAKAALAAPKLQKRPAAAPAPKPAPAAVPPAPEPAAPPILQTMVAAPPAPEAVPGADQPAANLPDTWVPPAATPPVPAYTPPVPAYVPPAQPQVPAVQPEPRLRDKIIERIPIINRFHDPQPMYPTN